MSALMELLIGRRLVVCAGAGGVGKTTVSAALALVAARQGKRVLVLTIDPSRRLAETLGIATNLPEPVALPADRLAAAGVKAPGSVAGWVLDPVRITDRVVEKLARTPEEAARLRGNRIYQGVSQMVAGMQEYTAVEALHGLAGSGQYDIIILDTPPSRNALSFLDAPIRLGKFLDGRIFKLFLPAKDGMIRGAARKVTRMVMSTALGTEAYDDLSAFMESFAVIFKVLAGNAEAMHQRLQQPDATFLMVTSSAQAAVYDALHFRKRLVRLGLSCGGYVLNRSLLFDGECPLPTPDLLPPDASVILREAWRKLAILGEEEQDQADAEQAILARLAEAAGEEGVAISLPEIAGGVEDIPGLALLVTRIEN